MPHLNNHTSENRSFALMREIKQKKAAKVFVTYCYSISALFMQSFFTARNSQLLVKILYKLFTLTNSTSINLNEVFKWSL